MITRFYALFASDANEGGPAKSDQSNYSTERTPITALLFEAKRRILLPLVRLEDSLNSAEYFPKAGRKVACQEP